ncbi:MAG: deoxyribose-phosphate aldolase [Erysipelotrichaceae bacterium]|nr:deoxyribose-phosphate aldolase [Erysipelotrichaceae bacterium]
MKAMNKYIDHTLLKPQAQKEDIKKLCSEAKEYDFASVCVNPCWVSYCHGLLKDTDVKVCTVIGFPLGSTSSKAKAYEAQQAVIDGADELDMVINIGALKDHDYPAVVQDIAGVVAKAKGRCVKVIIETCLLTDEEKITACQAAMEANADFVKTSTGFSTGGATADDVKLMKSVVNGRLAVKASGGIRSLEDMMIMIEAGATRIGTSGGVKIMQGTKTEGHY